MIYVTRFSFLISNRWVKEYAKNLHVSVEGDSKKSILRPFYEQKITWHVIIVFFIIYKLMTLILFRYIDNQNSCTLKKGLKKIIIMASLDNSCIIFKHVLYV